jgi:hypothetical protein
LRRVRGSKQILNSSHFHTSSILLLLLLVGFSIGSISSQSTIRSLLETVAMQAVLLQKSNASGFNYPPEENASHPSLDSLTTDPDINSNSSTSIMAGSCSKTLKTCKTDTRKQSEPSPQAGKSCCCKSIATQPPETADSNTPKDTSIDVLTPNTGESEDISVRKDSEITDAISRGGASADLQNKSSGSLICQSRLMVM